MTWLWITISLILYTFFIKSFYLCLSNKIQRINRSDNGKFNYNYDEKSAISIYITKNNYFVCGFIDGSIALILIILEFSIKIIVNHF